jgi:uncharacterized membrane protein
VEAPPSAEGVRVGDLRPPVAALARAERPGLGDADRLPPEEVHRLRMAHLAQTLLADRVELSAADHAVLDTIAADRLLAENPDDAVQATMTLGERVADRVASFGGSWTFILSFFALLGAWIVVNAYLLGAKPFDPYPFILLNLILSCLASIQAPIIMMSQNRKESRDRAQAEHDYRVNLKAEIEVRLLHEKLDHLMLHQWGRLLDVQEDQGALLGEIVDRLDGAPKGGDAPGS